MTDEKNYTRLFVHGMSITILATVLITILNYLFRMILARTFTTTQLGLFFAIFTIPSVLGTVKHLGAGTALVKEMAEAMAKKNLEYVRLLFRAFLLLELFSYGLTVLLIFLIAKPLAIYYFKTSDAIPLIYLLMTASFFTIVDTAVYGVMLAKKNVVMIQVVNILRPLLLVSITAIAVQISATMFTIASIHVLVYGTLACIHWYWYHYTFLNVKTQNTSTLPEMKKLFISGIPILFGVAATTALSNIDVILLTSLKNLSEVGVYSAAVLPTASLLRQLVKMISFLIPPIATELFVLDKTRFELSIERMQKYSILTLIPLMVCLIFFSSWVLETFFGKEYSTVGSLALKILAFGGLGSSLFMINTGVIAGIGRYSIYAFLTLLLAVISIIGNFILIPRFSVTGAGFSNALTFTIGAIASTIILYKIHKYKVPWIAWLKAFIAGFFMYQIIWFITPSTIHFWSVIVCSIFGTLVYVLMLFLLKVITIKEVFNITQHIPLISKVVKKIEKE